MNCKQMPVSRRAWRASSTLSSSRRNKPMPERIVTFPHMGNYYIAEKTIAKLFGDEVLPPPRITKRTLELGAKHSPESVCIPFKYTLGNFIEALDNGANFILQAGAGCRMGMYGEIQKIILR